MGKIWNSFKRFWQNNLVKRLKIVSARIGKFLITIGSLSIALMTYIIMTYVAPVELAYFLVGSWIAGVVLFNGVVIDVMKNGWHPIDQSTVPQ